MTQRNFQNKIQRIRKKVKDECNSKNITKVENKKQRSNTWTFGAPKINRHGNIFLNDNS